jgi:hypothetical protein
MENKSIWFGTHVSHKKAKVLIAMLCEAIKLLKKKNLNFPLITDLGKIEEIF